MTANMTAFIFARGGSKGLPGKNVKLLLGKPLIGWAIDAALGVPEIGRVVVSTDDPKIAEVAKDCGAQVPFMRPVELASDGAAEWDAWRHALNWCYDIEGTLPDPFISVPATAPCRLSKDISASIDRYKIGDVDLVLTISKAHRNPWFNMVKPSMKDTFELVNDLDESITRRQDAPEVFDVTTVAYVADPSFILEHHQPFSGRVGAVEVPVERSLDIDTHYDFSVAEALIAQRVKEEI